jgi:hypothetical protein
VNITINGEAFVHVLIIAAALFCAWTIVRNSFGIGLDDTDKDGWNRSNLRIYTDHKTGLQYLGTSGGGLTPRLDAEGKQMSDGRIQP